MPQGYLNKRSVSPHFAAPGLFRCGFLRFIHIVCIYAADFAQIWPKHSNFYLQSGQIVLYWYIELTYYAYTRPMKPDSEGFLCPKK